MAKHTPGPWHKDWIAGALRHICKNVDCEMFLLDPLPEDANTPNYYGTGDVDLIAAAPELLDACEAAKEDVHSDCSGSPMEACSDLCELLATAIAKAKGQ